MNVSAETIPYPINHSVHRRKVPTKHSSMYVSSSPLAMNNKIRAIQTRKSRITLQSYCDFTDIRPLNIAQNGRMYNSTTSFSNLSPEKLVERSKELRLARIAARPNLGTSVLSTTSIANQQSLIWPQNNSSNAFGQENQINSPTAHKSSIANMPDILQRTHRTNTTNTRTLLNEQQNKSIPKTKPSIPKAYDRTIAKVKSSFPSTNPALTPIFHNDYFKQMNTNAIQFYESEEDEENNPIEIDEEFEEYVQKAMVKCADWLIKYVFDKTYDQIEE